MEDVPGHTDPFTCIQTSLSVLDMGEVAYLSSSARISKSRSIRSANRNMTDPQLDFLQNRGYRTAEEDPLAARSVACILFPQVVLNASLAATTARSTSSLLAFWKSSNLEPSAGL